MKTLYYQRDKALDIVEDINRLKAQQLWPEPAVITYDDNRIIVRCPAS